MHAALVQVGGHHHPAEASADDRDVGLLDDGCTVEAGIGEGVPVEVREGAADLLELLLPFRSSLHSLVALESVPRA
jgi:hypothetical protein